MPQPSAHERTFLDDDKEAQAAGKLEVTSPTTAGTLLHEAVRYQSVEAVEYFLMRCHNPVVLNTQETGKNGYSAFHLAALLAGKKPDENAFAILQMIAQKTGVDHKLLSGHEGGAVRGTAEQYFRVAYEDQSHHICSYTDDAGKPREITDIDAAAGLYYAIIAGKKIDTRYDEAKARRNEERAKQRDAAKATQTTAAPIDPSSRRSSGDSTAAGSSGDEVSSTTANVVRQRKKAPVDEETAPLLPKDRRRSPSPSHRIKQPPPTLVHNVLKMMGLV